MHPHGQSEEFFCIDVNSDDFNRLWVFSMSNCVRNLLNQGIKTIDVCMNGVEERLAWLDKICKKN